MCGINGIFAYNSAAGEPAEQELVATRDYMQRRGPDGHGAWWNEQRRVALGHRRLAILDLSERAAQPMLNESGTLAVTFNGEIYNYPALRAELELSGVHFRTTSDTEVLLHLYERDGEAMVHRLRGMFAFAIWDARANALFLARDPYGIKPLYVADDGWHFRFASQVKALLAGGRVSHDPEPAGIVGFHLWGSVPEPFTLYRDVRALPAGHTQWIDSAGPRAPKPYASIAAVLAKSVLAKSARQSASGAEVEAHVRAATLESVAAHLLADVEVGVFLSAGIDSGVLLGLMRDAGQKKVRAITLAFDEFKGSLQDEVPLAAQMAALYGAQHVVRRVDEAEFRQDLPQILAAMDQPSIDGINAWFVSKAAAEAGLKVTLSGLGGDELFGGYPSFRDVPRWHRWMRVPGAVPGLGRAFRHTARTLNLFAGAPKALGMAEYGGTIAGAYFLRRGLFLPFELDTQLDPTLLREGLRRLRNIERVTRAMTPDSGDDQTRVTALESSWYMRHQLLRDADWAGMAHSLEIRTPLVDFTLLQKVAPYMAQLRGKQGKTALAKAPRTPLPDLLVQRAKTGFTIPTARWARRSLVSTTAATPGGDSRSWGQNVFAQFVV
jgi:asparagine synthase (glutamine-hydrolysing)